MSSSDTKKRILRLLQKNARMPAQEIADRLQISVEEVNDLIRDMEDDRTIIGYGVFVNDDNLQESPVRALIEVEVSPERDGGFDRIARAVSRFPEVRTVQLLSGSYDLSLEVVGNTLQDVAQFVASKLAVQEGVRATRTHFLLRKYKEAGFVRHEEEEYERLKVAP